jgi:isopenicillin-N epimerase
MAFFNHGSFGSCPLAVLEFQSKLRQRMERQPIQFFVRDLEPLLDQARRDLARFLGTSSEDLVFVPNATAGVNTVLRSLSWRRGDELLVTNHEYNATHNALNFIAQKSGARVVTARAPFPVKSDDAIFESVMEKVTGRTRLALFDHVTSQTGLIFPIQRLARALARRGIETLVDGAHAPGMIPLDLQKLGATYYTGNCHKWLCAPKGAGFLYVRHDRQELIRPLAISHGANSPRQDRSRFLIEFGWTGTWDPSAYLSVPRALDYVGSLLPGSWPAIMCHNHELAVAARRVLCQKLEIDLPCPDEMIGALAAIPIADAIKAAPARSPLYLDPLQDQLWSEEKIEVPIIPWPSAPRRVLRVSAQLYNSLPQYERLADALWRRLRQ